MGTSRHTKQYTREMRERLDQEEAADWFERFQGID